ncbi:MAG TPA: hemerythrin domain-containing protein [Planctomycetota bacterium]|nr:hemerythrin domain-containing protein [Planctomycetota bacterium]
MRSLLELLQVHTGLHERFAVHRDFVVSLEFGRALVELDAFERDLRVHMDAEEAHLLPVYRSRVGRVLGGDPDFFILEHRNILRNLETVKQALRSLAESPQAGRRQAHEFLDQEWMLQNLMKHHDLREKNILYPKLDEVLSDDERECLLSRCGLLRG